MFRSALLVTALLSLTVAVRADDARGARVRASALLALSHDGTGYDDTVCGTRAWDERIQCLLTHRFGDDERALERTRALYTRHGVIVGVEEAHEMDGGFRGLLHLVPERPVGRYARHLDYVLAAHDDIEATLESLRPHARTPITYQHRAIVYRFFRSVGRTTPSAYASDVTIGYNVSGSLHRSADAVRGTLVHEIFHLNDQAAGSWSERALVAQHRAIVERCNGARACLAPFAPTDTVVRGGTYYSFQPNNGEAVVEYAAELASRFIDEHRQMRTRGSLSRAPFKCRNAENALAYASVSNAFFGGVDLTPACRR